jgi:hypothetical protein
LPTAAVMPSEPMVVRRSTETMPARRFPNQRSIECQ